MRLSSQRDQTVSHFNTVWFLFVACGLVKGSYVIRRINTWLVGFQRSNYSACFTMFGGSLCIKDRKSQNKDLYQHRELKNISIKYGDIKIWKEIDKAMPLLSSSLFLSFSFPFEKCLCCSLKYSQPYSLTKLRKSLAPMWQLRPVSAFVLFASRNRLFRIPFLLV